MDKTFNAGVKVGLAIVERKEMQYLYPDGSDLVFMDLQTYEQLHVPGTVVGEAGRYVTEGGQATVATHQGVPISVDLPASMTSGGHQHGSGRQGGHAHERAEAGHARDRRGGAGPAVRRRGRSGEGGHALGRVHRTREGVTSRRDARRDRDRHPVPGGHHRCGSRRRARGVDRGRPFRVRRSPPSWSMGWRSTCRRST